MTEEEFAKIQWQFKESKNLGRKFGRGETLRKTYVSVNTSPKLYKNEDYRRWTVRAQIRTRVDVSYKDSGSEKIFEHKDIGRMVIKLKEDEKTYTRRKREKRYGEGEA